MKAAAIIIGINDWEKYTLPLIKQIQQHEPKAAIYCVDAGSDVPYPKVPGVVMIHRKTKSYAQAINLAADRAIRGGAEWIVSMNNDVGCLGAFIPLLDSLTPDTIYSRQIIEENGLTWFGNWVVAIPANVFLLLDGFDEDYLVCGFEDADLSARAIQFGVKTKAADLPFVHYWNSPRWQIPGYSQTRQDNIKRFADKFGWTPGREMVVTHE